MKSGCTRRRFMRQSAAMLGLAALCPSTVRAARKPRIAALNTIYHRLSHAYHIVGRFVNGYTVKGRHHQPAFDVVRMYTDQYFEDDVSRPFAQKHGIALTANIAAALGGKDHLDVDAVLLIGEHGRYPTNAIGQTLYPRYEFFEQIVEVFKQSGRSVPVFCDKHLSYDYRKAHRMVATAKQLGFGLMAGSSLPVTFRRPEWEPALKAPIREAVVVYYGGLEIYGFHALEVLQCVLERRQGGETGVKSVRGLKGAAVWKAADEGLWDPNLLESALRRSVTRDFGNARDQVPEPHAFLVEYLDGTRAALLRFERYVADLTIAIKLAGDPKPQSALFYLPAPPGARFFNPLTYYIEEFFTTGKTPYPVERTLLTSTVLDFALRSMAAGGTTLTDPALAVQYQPVDRSFFFRGPASDE